MQKSVWGVLKWLDGSNEAGKCRKGGIGREGDVCLRE